MSLCQTLKYVGEVTYSSTSSQPQNYVEVSCQNSHKKCLPHHY